MNKLFFLCVITLCSAYASGQVTPPVAINVSDTAWTRLRATSASDGRTLFMQAVHNPAKDRTLYCFAPGNYSIAAKVDTNVVSGFAIKAYKNNDSIPLRCPEVGASAYPAYDAFYYTSAQFGQTFMIVPVSPY